MADSTESGGEDVTTARDLTQTKCFIQTLYLEWNSIIMLMVHATIWEFLDKF